jgi:hypothetical protein
MADSLAAINHTIFTDSVLQLLLETASTNPSKFDEQALTVNVPEFLVATKRPVLAVFPGPITPGSQDGVSAFMLK